MVSEESVVWTLVQVVSSNVMSFTVALITVVTAAWYIRDSMKIDEVGEKYVLVTGCDSGFGRLVARQLDQRGFRVFAACLTQSGADSLHAETSNRLRTLLINVTNSASITSAVELVRRKTRDRGLWGLVNNAGRAVPIGPTEWMKLEDFKLVLDVNLLGLIDVTLQFLPLLKTSKGRVVNVASILGRLSLTGGGYCLSKWGVEAFSDGLRREMQHFGINVSIIEPGFFKTRVTDLDLIAADLKTRWNNLPADVKKSYGESYLKKYLEVQESSITYLCSENLSTVTSCMLHALSAKYPRTRYGAGWDAKFFWIPLSYMPSCIADLFGSPVLPKGN